VFICNFRNTRRMVVFRHARGLKWMLLLSWE